VAGTSAGADTFALYLAKQLVAAAGFRAGTVAEAAPLAQACDIVLTGMEGLAFTIVCIVDRERDPGREFGLSQAEVEAIGVACAKYSGALSGMQAPASIRIIEAGDRPPTTAQRARLGVFRRRAFFTRFVPSAWIVDSSAGTVWSSASFGGRFQGRAFIERLLREPRVADDAMGPVVVAMQAPRAPVATYGLLALLATVFVAEQTLAVDPPTGGLTPGIGTLVALGGLNRALVAGGEWWRMLSSALLHGGLMHIAFNAIALLMAGRFLESLVGRAWFLALFVIGAIGGAAMSLAINPPEIVSVGASGAIMALLSAAFVACLRLPKSPQRVGMQVGLAQVLVPSLLPLAFGHGTGLGDAGSLHIDYGAHVGGALTGVVAGFALLRVWPTGQSLPRLRALAAAIVLAGAAGAVSAGIGVARHYDDYAVAEKLIPPDQIPRSAEEERRHARDLLARYPHDPRAHAMVASLLLEEPRDLAGAIRELRAALAEEGLLARFDPSLSLRIQTTLALVLAEDGRPDEARAAAAPACAAPGPDKYRMRARLQARGLCGETP
jgi:rhomboid protease GluP